ncbi:MAG: GNAT family N-acetyltransferase [Candidatus Eisenbacteria bacterium]
MPGEQAPLIEGYTVADLEAEEFEEIFRSHRKEVFAETIDLFPERYLSDEEKARIEGLRARMGEPFRLRLGIYQEDRLAGWFTGVQSDAGRFYMANTGIFKEHQGRGIYKALLPRILDRVRAEGFQIAWSRHTATNNRVIVPKLKAGFLITGFELSDVFGLLVHLSYFMNPMRRRILDYRSGQCAPDAELRKLLGF